MRDRRRGSYVVSSSATSCKTWDVGHAYGGANAWLLTAYGERVLDATRHSLVPGAGAVMGRRVRGAA